MPLPTHPETGTAYRHARERLFGLLAVTVALGALLNLFASHLPTFRAQDWRWWAGTSVLLIGGLWLVLIGIWLEDRHGAPLETRVELLLCYVVRGRTRRAQLGLRKSYAVTRTAQQAWKAAFGRQGPSLRGAQPEAEFTKQVERDHMALLRHLLILYLSRFGREVHPQKAMYGWLQLEIPARRIPWQDLAPAVRDNPFSNAIGQARPGKLLLPDGASLVVSTEGDVPLRLAWRPHQSWLCRLLGVLTTPPGGELRVRHVGQLSELRRFDTPYRHLTARLKNVRSADLHVVSTRLMVEVDTRWNLLREVGRFRDWAINLAEYLREQMDYPLWREGYLERTVDNLDWKIGWVERGEEPGLAGRLRRLDERLARLEAHLWPDEPAQGGGGGAWLSGAVDDTPAEPDEAARDASAERDDVGG